MLTLNSLLDTNMTKAGLVIERAEATGPWLLLVDGIYATMRVEHEGDGVLFLKQASMNESGFKLFGPSNCAFQSMEDLGDMVIMKDCVEI